MPRDTCAMSQHVPQRHTIVQFNVVKANGGNGIANGFIPREFAVLYQQTCRNGRKQFRVRPDREQRVRGNG